MKNRRMIYCSLQFKGEFMGKNIIILSDGTGQDGGSGHNTNVYKLFNMLLQRSPDQMVFYDQGLGTESNGLLMKAKGLISKATGLGISKNIKQCYQFLFDNYQAGDQIYLLGFSRGATTIRSLSSFIHLFGILPQSRPELVKQAYNIYKEKNQKKRQKRADDFIARHHTMWTKIKFIGAWDTVAALGVPFKWADKLLNALPFFKHGFQNLTLSPSVQNAYHALAIDDERLTFHPVLWDAEVEEEQRVKQVWFAGMHTDVGGGYKENTLSDVPLQWIIEKAVKHGLLIYPNHTVEISPDSDGVMHNSRGKFFEKIYKSKERFWPSGRSDVPLVHVSVTERTKNKKNENDPTYQPWILKENYKVEP